MIRSRIRDMIFALVERHGYVVRLEQDLPRGFKRFLALAKQAGLQPNTVFDVGVGTGTPWLYAAFPKAYFVLVEALDLFENDLRRISSHMTAEYHIVGVGEREESRSILISDAVPTSSSIYPIHKDRAAFESSVPIHKRPHTIHLKPLDEFGNQRPPFLLKLDVEGGELPALRGAVAVLRQTQMVIAEISIMNRYDGEASFAEVVEFMHRHGFRLFDIIELNHLGSDGPLSYVDVAFVPDCFPATRAQQSA